jgi:hypothetical protein
MKRSALREGEYSVWFRTPSRTGTALVRVKDGRLFGGDAYIDYEGQYRFDGEKFDAVIKTKRHTDGPPTWFGVDELTIRVSGKSTGRNSAGAATVDQCPGLSLEVTLMRIEDEETRHVDYSKLKLHPERLPSPGREHVWRAPTPPCTGSNDRRRRGGGA